MTSLGISEPPASPSELAARLVDRTKRVVRFAKVMAERTASGVQRAAALRVLQAGWSGGRIDLVLPEGDRVSIGDARSDAGAVVHVRDERLFRRLLLRGELGAGEAFTAGEWDADDLVDVCRVFLRGTGARGAESLLSKLARLPTWVQHRRAANTVAGSRRNISAHYDLGNDFYRSFLDPETLAYSCAWWPPGRETANLSDAQSAKHERLCAWLGLTARDHLLEIGCGWGGMAIHAAATRGCRVTAVTVSREQHALARQRVAEAGLADRVSIELRDYRTLAGTFDHVVSIEMLEAVGEAFLPTYFQRVAQVLAPGGRFALQSITMPDDRFETYRRGVDWMQTYIFPGSLIPSLGVIERHTRAAGLHEVQRDDIGPDYARTLRLWRERFMAACSADAPAAGRPTWARDPEFVRTWLLYLAFSEAAFAERTLGDHQLVFVRK
jgi:cyclopropane-fatty-acyl-phospholipid synthase